MKQIRKPEGCLSVSEHDFFKMNRIRWIWYTAFTQNWRFVKFSPITNLELNLSTGSLCRHVGVFQCKHDKLKMHLGVG